MANPNPTLTLAPTLRLSLSLSLSLTQGDDFFANACSFALVAVFFFCIVMKIRVLTEEVDYVISGQLRGKYGFDVLLVTGGMIASIVGSLALTAVVAAQQVVKAANKPTFRLLSTKAPPALPLAKGHKWHLFLSHIWGTGQDQCATIKRQLCLLLPGASIFLDVDDLEDIGMLEEYIEASGVVMIFVSQGYFKSANCLREVRCALSKDKPLSRVHDPVRGGASLEAIKAECPTEMRGSLFSRDHPVIIFHRIKDYQIVSLRLLAEDMLRGCPNFGAPLSSFHSFSSSKQPIATYTSATSAAAAEKADADEQADVQLALPGEVTRKRLNFHTPVTVYASPYNPGAAAALAALQEGFIQLQAPVRRLTLTGAPLPSFLSKHTTAEGDAPSLLATSHAEARRESGSRQDSRSSESQASAEEGAEGRDAMAPRRNPSPPPSPPAPPPPATTVQKMKVSWAATAVVDVVSRATRRSSNLDTTLEPDGSHGSQPATRLPPPKLGKRAQIRATAIPPWQVTRMATTSASDSGDGTRRVGLGRIGQILTGLSDNMLPRSEANRRKQESRAGNGPTHMLLYLNKDTFVGEAGKAPRRPQS